MEELILRYGVMINFSFNDSDTMIIDDTDSFKNYKLKLIPVTDTCLLNAPMTVEGNSLAECTDKAKSLLKQLEDEQAQAFRQSIEFKMSMDELTDTDIEYMLHS